jgi:PAS domain-containing protein
MLGITVNHLMGESREHNGAHWNEAEYAVFKANIAARRPFIDFIYSRTKADGSIQYLMVSGEPMFDSSGRFTGYRGIGKDVTDSMRSKQSS